MSSRKECPIRGCEEYINPRFLMCHEHWRLVSPATQRQIFKTLNAYKRGTLPQSKYLEAVDAARKEVALCLSQKHRSSAA